jgi:transposase
MKITTIGLDLAKHWFQVHGVDAQGQTIARRKLRRSEVIAYFKSIEPCLVGMEATWPPSEADAAGLREGLRQAQQERRS